MKPQAPVVDVLIQRERDGWRLLMASMSWPGMLRARVDARREIFPVGRPDAGDLEAFMFETDSPYEHQKTSDGGLEIRARGRSAVTLMVWLEELVTKTAAVDAAVEP